MDFFCPKLITQRQFNKWQKCIRSFWSSKRCTFSLVYPTHATGTKNIPNRNFSTKSSRNPKTTDYYVAHLTAFHRSFSLIKLIWSICSKMKKKWTKSNGFLSLWLFPAVTAKFSNTLLRFMFFQDFIFVWSYASSLFFSFFFSDANWMTSNKKQSQIQLNVTKWWENCAAV